MAGKREPKDNGGNVHDLTTGKFLVGNPGGPGRGKSNRHILVNRLMDEEVTDKRAATIIAKWLTLAEAGEQWAVREFLDRTLGKAHQTIDATVAVSLADAIAAIRKERHVSRV